MLRAIAICGMAAGLAAISPAPGAAQAVQAVPSQPDQAGNVPVYEVNVVGRTITAVNFHVLGDETLLHLQGTTLLPSAHGKVKVKILRGTTYVHVAIHHMHPAQRFGPEYLTYVMWAISPNGLAKNLGEIQLSGESARMDATTTLQNFGLIVTAEPYFGVSRPSNVVVMEAQPTEDTVGAQATVEAKYELLQRGQYSLNVPQAEISELPQNPKVPLDLYEAENAVRIARWAGADRYAASIYQKARTQMQQAEDYEFRHAGKGPVATIARAAVETAEDARLLTMQRRRQAHEAKLQMETRAQAAQAQQQAQEQAEAAQSAREQAQAEHEQASLAREQAENQAAAAALAREQARSERQKSQAEVQRVRQQERRARAQLMRQLNSVLETRDTASGLIMEMPDVQFGFDKATLVPSAKIKLAKVAGILLSYPDLKVQVNGYTDDVGSSAYNQRLSEERAETARNFLVAQGVSSDSISAQGMGPSSPVASNATPAGRQQNRRVELVVNGEAIGSPAPQTEAPTQPEQAAPESQPPEQP